MSTEELFLRQIDSIDGNIEVIVHPDQPMTCVSTGPFVWQVENADRDQVIEAIARRLAAPNERPYQESVRLESGEDLQVAVDQIRNSMLWISGGAVYLHLHFSTTSLLVGALSEARAWQRNRLLAAGGKAVASC